MPTNDEQIRDELGLKLRALDQAKKLLLDAIVAKRTEPELAALFRGLDDARNEAAAVLPSLQRAEADFTEFMTHIGESLRSAQERLDDASDEYLQALKASKRAHIPPTIFRIPKLTADMKFSLERVGSKKVSVVFYSKEDKVRELHQQSVSLEIVAVPPPADWNPEAPPQPPPHAPRALSHAAPPRRRGEAPELPVPEPLAGPLLPSFREAAAPPALRAGVEDPARREDIFARVGRARGKTAAATRALQKRLLLDNRERVLIIADEHDTAYFLVLARTGRAPELAAWQLASEPDALTLIYRWPRDSARRKALAPLHAFLAALCDRQARKARRRR